MKQLTNSRGMLLILLTATTPVIWGTSYLVTTEFLPVERPILTAILRTLPAGILLMLASRNLIPGISIGRLATLSVLNISIFQAMLFVAAYRLPGGMPL